MTTTTTTTTFNSLLSGQPGSASTRKAEQMMGWQWHKLDHTQIIYLHYFSRYVTMLAARHSIFIGWRLFLMLKQQCQSTEGKNRRQEGEWHLELALNNSQCEGSMGSIIAGISWWIKQGWGQRVSSLQFFDIADEVTRRAFSFKNTCSNNAQWFSFKQMEEKN